MATAESGSSDDRRHELYAELRHDVSAVRSALRAIREGRDTDTYALKEIVARLAANARSKGVQPERVLIALTRSMADDAVEHLSLWWRRMVRRRLVRWLLEAYYGRRA
jgi:hypothetical protein